jgi:hypothetical protein
MQRRRFKHTTSFQDRLAQEAKRLREEAGKAKSAQEYDRLLRKAGQAETVAHVDEWLSSPGLQPPT